MKIMGKHYRGVIVRHDRSFNLAWSHTAPFNEPYMLVEMNDLNLAAFISKIEVKIAPLGYCDVVAKMPHNGADNISDEQWLELLIEAEENCKKLFR